MTAPAYKKYQADLSEAKRDPHKDFVNSQVFLSEHDDPLATKHQDEQQPKSNKTLKIDFGDEVNAQKHIATQKPLESNQEELLRWHYRLGHVSFNKLKETALRGDIPRTLATCEAPKCAACTRRPWRNKREVRSIRPRNITLTGDCVSIDQFESSTPGFIGLMRGFPTKMRYISGTVFTDHHSRLSFIHLHKSLSALETLHAKHCFERYCKQHSIEVKHYHADNGRFADNTFLADVEQNGQTISFCAVNSH